MVITNFMLEVSYQNVVMDSENLCNINSIFEALILMLKQYYPELNMSIVGSIILQEMCCGTGKLQCCHINLEQCPLVVDSS